MKENQKGSYSSFKANESEYIFRGIKGNVSNFSLNFESGTFILKFDVLNDSKVKYFKFQKKNNEYFTKIISRVSKTEGMISFSNQEIMDKDVYGVHKIFIFVEEDKVIREKKVFIDSENLNMKLEAYDEENSNVLKICVTKEFTVELEIYKSSLMVNDIIFGEVESIINFKFISKELNLKYLLCQSRLLEGEELYAELKIRGVDSSSFSLNNNLFKEIKEGFWNIFGIGVSTDNEFQKYRVEANAFETTNFIEERNELIFYKTADDLLSIRYKQAQPELYISKKLAICNDSERVEFEANNAELIDYIFVRNRNKLNECILKHQIINGKVSILVKELLSVTEEINGVYDFFYQSTNNDDSVKITRVITQGEGNQIYFEKNIITGNKCPRYTRLYATQDQHLAMYIQNVHFELLNVKHNKQDISLEFQVPNSYIYDFFPVRSTLIAGGKELSKTSISLKQNNLINLVFTITNDKLVELVNHQDADKLELEIIINSNNCKTKKARIFEFNEGLATEKYKIYPEFAIRKKFKARVFFSNSFLYLKVSEDKEFVISSTSNKSKIEFIPNEFSDDSYELIVKYNSLLYVIGSLESDGEVYRYLPITENSDMKTLNIYSEIFVRNGRTRAINNVNCEINTFNPYAYNIKNKSNTLEIEVFCKDDKLYFKSRTVVTERSKTYKLKATLAKLIGSSIKKITNQKVWLVGENLGLSYQDNGLAFYESAIKKRIDEKVYFITRNREDLADRQDISENVLAYDSFKHMVKYWQSEKLIVSHGDRDVIPSILHYTNKNKRSIYYLQHGIVAMKRLGYHPNSYNGKLKKMTVSSSKEANYFKKYMSFTDGKIMNTGLIRYDKLENRSESMNKKIIFIMPTWREWLVNGNREFSDSLYYTEYRRLLTDKSLNDYLVKKNMEIKFLPHIEMRQQFSADFTTELSNITMVNTDEVSIQEMIKNSSLLITDYSSVAFDFSYLYKPVLFFQFDLNEYLSYRGSYINMNRELFGPLSKEYSDLKKEIIKQIDNNFVIDQKYQNKAELFFDHHDKNNFDRAYNTIRKG